jgi:hypothetical protein
MTRGLVIMRRMKWWIACLVLCVACGSGDDTSDGARGECAFGGELTDCPDAPRTSEGACWRLVDCGAIPLEVENEMNPNELDWGVCVDFIETRTSDRQRLVISCIAAMTCDELRVQFTDPVENFCFELGQ